MSVGKYDGKPRYFLRLVVGVPWPWPYELFALGIDRITFYDTFLKPPRMGSGVFIALLGRTVTVFYCAFEKYSLSPC